MEYKHKWIDRGACAKCLQQTQRVDCFCEWCGKAWCKKCESDTKDTCFFCRRTPFKCQSFDQLWEMVNQDIKQVAEEGWDQDDGTVSRPTETVIKHARQVVDRYKQRVADRNCVGLPIVSIDPADITIRLIWRDDRVLLQCNCKNQSFVVTQMNLSDPFNDKDSFFQYFEEKDFDLLIDTLDKLIQKK